MLSLGIFSIAWWPVLPGLEIIFAAMVCSIPVCISLWNAPKFRLLFSLLMGISLGLISAHLVVKNSLPVAFDGEDIVLTGTIVGLVDSNAKRSRFSFHVDSARPVADSSHEIALKKILISWYGKTI
jgi:competence protein ComEC